MPNKHMLALDRQAHQWTSQVYQSTVHPRDLKRNREQGLYHSICSHLRTVPVQNAKVEAIPGEHEPKGPQHCRRIHSRRSNKGQHEDAIARDAANDAGLMHSQKPGIRLWADSRQASRVTATLAVLGETSREPHWASDQPHARNLSPKYLALRLDRYCTASKCGPKSRLHYVT